MLENLNHPLVKEILEHVSQEEVLANWGAIQMYLNNPEECEIVYEPYLSVVRRVKNNNPAIRYLQEIFFPSPINITDFDLQDPSSSNSRMLLLDKIDKHESLYICGANGVGKTTYTIACCNNTYKKDKQQYLYISWPDFIDKVKNFNDNKGLLTKAKVAPIIIIDDLGNENITKFSRDEILFSLINYRLERQLQTIIISNYLPEELMHRYILNPNESKITTTLHSKISGLCQSINLLGKNYRNGE